MNNIFENAYFGKSYKTRDGKKAVYHKYDSLSNRHCLVHSGFSSDIKHTSDGVCSLEYKFQTSKGNSFFKCDIVSEWKEPIGEKELDKLADEYAEGRWNSYAMIERRAFKDGYRKAKEE